MLLYYFPSYCHQTPIQATDCVFIYSFYENLMLSLVCLILSVLFTNGHNISLQFFNHLIFKHPKFFSTFCCPRWLTSNQAQQNRLQARQISIKSENVWCVRYCPEPASGPISVPFYDIRENMSFLRKKLKSTKMIILIWKIYYSESVFHGDSE